MSVEIEAVSVGQGVRSMRRGKPRGLYAFITRALGKEILVLGPSTAGKSKFTEYLRLGTLDPEGQREMTYRVRKTPAFTVGLGREQGVTLKIRRAVDTPGQVGPVEHAALVGRRKPHAVIVVLDSSKATVMTTMWLHLFCDRLDTVLRRRFTAKRRLSEVMVLLNKRDKIDGADFNRLREEVAAVLQKHLAVVFGAERVRSIPIMECVSVQTEEGPVLIDRVVSKLTERLAR